MDRQAGDLCGQGQEARGHVDKGQLEGVSTTSLTLLALESVSSSSSESAFSPESQNTHICTRLYSVTTVFMHIPKLNSYIKRKTILLVFCFTDGTMEAKAIKSE